MTNAMKQMLRELMGYRSGNVLCGERQFSYIVSRADRSAAEALAEIGVINIVEDERGIRAYRAVKERGGVNV